VFLWFESAVYETALIKIDSQFAKQYCKYFSTKALTQLRERFCVR